MAFPVVPSHRLGDTHCMCGILGIIARKNTTSPLTQRDILAMRDTMAARGPDESGLFQKNNCIAAHCRLAIRDREGGKQLPVGMARGGWYFLDETGEQVLRLKPQNWLLI